MVFANTLFSFLYFINTSLYSERMHETTKNTVWFWHRLDVATTFPEHGSAQTCRKERMSQRAPINQNQLQISRKSCKIHENPRLQYFGLGPVRLWAKHSQTVWDKILYLTSGFWEKLGFQKKMTKETRNDLAKLSEKCIQILVTIASLT